jgi:glycerophosphoryl diester phosphodiesterase
MKPNLVVLFSALVFTNATFSANALSSMQDVSVKPDVIAHRGASGYLPEHTLESLILAYSQGANYIEQDLVLSKDGIAVVLHDIHLETVTDVEQKYPERMRDDKRYYAYDFTLKELKTLRVHERQDAEGKQVFANRYQGQSDFKIATFEEQILLIEQLNRQFSKNVGLYPEIKSPAWHLAQGIDISEIVLTILRKYELDDSSKPVYVQCFDFSEIKRLRQKLGAKVKLVQLIADPSWEESSTDYNYILSPAGLNDVAKYADGIGPWIPQLLNMQTMQPTHVMETAKRAGLLVHPYTFRKDELPPNISANQSLDILFKVLKVDGIFTDFTDVVVDYLDQ